MKHILLTLLLYMTVLSAHSKVPKPLYKIPLPKQGVVFAAINFTNIATVEKRCGENVVGCAYMDGIFTMVVVHKDSPCLPELLLHEVMHSAHQHGSWHEGEEVTECER